MLSMVSRAAAGIDILSRTVLRAVSKRSDPLSSALQDKYAPVGQFPLEQMQAFFNGREEKWRNYVDENAESDPTVNIWKIAKAQSEASTNRDKILSRSATEEITSK